MDSTRCRRPEGEPWSRAAAIRPTRLRFLPIVFAILMTPVTPTKSDALVDIGWVKRFQPVHGAFNRDEPSPVALTLSLDGQLDQIEVGWRVLQGETVVASGDTAVSGRAKTREKVFVLHLPALAPNSYVLDLSADPHNLIEEKDEGNNRIAYAFTVPNGKPARFRCESQDGTAWKLYRVELSTSAGAPYPDQYGTRPDTARSSEYELAVSGIPPGGYTGVLFGPSVNRQSVLVTSGSFDMPDPPREIRVVWPRTTPYIRSQPTIHGDIPPEGAVGGQSGPPRWKANDQISMEGKLYNPSDRSSDAQWLLRFVPPPPAASAERDTMITLGAFGSETIVVTGRVPMTPGKYLLQAEVRVPWPTGFEDLGDEDRVASHILPLGWIEVQR